MSRARETSMSQGPRIAHVPALDGLRGAAVFAVVAFHLDHLTGGYLGVDLFFVLSGYLITSLLLVEWSASGRISLSGFYVRRFRRLLPALLVVLAAVGIASHWEVLLTSRDELRASALATLAYVANWAAISSGAGYWDRTLVPSWLEHTWSLAIEEQFYVAWPLVALLVLRRGRSEGPPSAGRRRQVISRLAAVAGGGALASGTLMIVWSFLGGETQRLYLGTDTRAAALLLGCWAASRQQVAAIAPDSSARRALTVASVLAGGYLGVAWFRLDGDGDLLYRGGLLAASLAAMVVILDVTSPGRSVLRWPLEVAPLRFLGLISYGLYLWHWPVIQYLYVGRFGLRGLELDIVRILASLGIASLSYALVERPIRRAPRMRIRPVPSLAAVSLCVVALVAGTAGGYDIGGDDQRTSATNVRGAPVAMVVGDSVAFSLAEEGLVPRAKSLRLNIADRARIGCTLMQAVGDDSSPGISSNCSPQFRQDVEDVDPDVVFVLFGGYVGVHAVPVDGEDVWPCEPAWDRRWRQELDAVVDELSAGGATVVLSTAPTTSFHYLKLDQPKLFDARQACSNAVVRKVADRRPEAELYDLDRLVCPDGQNCVGELDGATLRPDGLHFAGGGARAVARRIGPVLVRAAGP